MDSAAFYYCEVPSPGPKKVNKNKNYTVHTYVVVGGGGLGLSPRSVFGHYTEMVFLNL